MYPTAVLATPGTRWSASSVPQKHPPARVAYSRPAGGEAGAREQGEPPREPNMAKAPAWRDREAAGDGGRWVRRWAGARASPEPKASARRRSEEGASRPPFASEAEEAGSEGDSGGLMLGI